MRTVYVVLIVVVLLFAAGVAYLFWPRPGPSSAAAGNVTLGQRTKTSGCAAEGALPDRACTPGALLAGAAKERVCVSGYASTVRDVPASEKEQVYAEYGIRSHAAGEYEVDHLISLELGGSNDISNLWPQPANPRPGFHEKDEVEDYLHRQVCSGALSLADAQRQISENWLAVYQRVHR